MKTFQDLYVSLSPDEKQKLAAAAGTSVAYLSQLANGHRQAGVTTIARLMLADKRISMAMLRPELA